MHFLTGFVDSRIPPQHTAQLHSYLLERSLKLGMTTSQYSKALATGSNKHHCSQDRFPGQKMNHRAREQSSPKGSHFWPPRNFLQNTNVCQMSLAMPCPANYPQKTPTVLTRSSRFAIITANLTRDLMPIFRNKLTFTG